MSNDISRLQLGLYASAHNWRYFMVRKSDPSFLPFKNKVLKRDHYTCRYCGFRSGCHMEVVNANQDYTRNVFSNLVTACPFCCQCLFLESMEQMGIAGGTLIMQEDISQSELNAVAHGMFALMLSNSDRVSVVKNLYRSWRMEAKQVEKSLGEGMSQPALLGKALVESNVSVKEHLQQQGWSALRLLPSFNAYFPYLEDWAKCSFDI